MRRSLMAMVAAAALTSASMPASKPAPAAEAAFAPTASPPLLRTVQFYGAGPYRGDDGWERSRQWRGWRERQDEARIAEAARREAWRIEQERGQRRALRRAQRYGHGPVYEYGYQRGW